MRKIVITFLFLLGVAEIGWSTLAAILYHNMGPEFARAFDVSKLTAEQQHALRRLEDTAQGRWGFVALFGVVTILIAIFLWAAEIGRKTDA